MVKGQVRWWWWSVVRCVCVRGMVKVIQWWCVEHRVRYDLTSSADHSNLS